MLTEESVQSLYQKTGKFALGKIMRIVGRQDVAEEILQDTFVKLWVKQIAFDSERGAYQWVYRTCHNASIDYLRSAAVKSEMSSTVLDGIEFCHPGASAEQQATMRQEILNSLRSLPENLAEVLVYREVDGMNQDEISEVMGISKRSVARIFAKLNKKFAVIDGGKQ